MGGDGLFGGSVDGWRPEDMAEKMLFVFAFFVRCPGAAVITERRLRREGSQATKVYC